MIERRCVQQWSKIKEVCNWKVETCGSCKHNAGGGIDPFKMMSNVIQSVWRLLCLDRSVSLPTEEKIETKYIFDPFLETVCCFSLIQQMQWLHDFVRGISYLIKEFELCYTQKSLLSPMIPTIYVPTVRWNTVFQWVTSDIHFYV